MENELKNRLATLEKKYIYTKYFGIGSVILLLLFGFGINKSGNPDIITTKGIIIKDQNGIDRILIGAPVPYSKDRVRTDTTLVRKYWASRFGENADQYMQWYSEYYHGTEGIIILNEEGFDRVLVGDKLADSNVGKRMFEASGITWNDKQGYELGGAGVNTLSDGSARAVVGLDNPEGEAIHLVAMEDGTNALIIGGANGLLIIGMAKQEGSFFQNKQPFTGIRYFDNQGNLIWEKQMDAGE